MSQFPSHRQAMTRSLTTYLSNYRQRLVIGVLLMGCGLILSKAHLFAPLHEFAHVVAAIITGVEVTSIGWHRVGYADMNMAILIVGFPAEMFVWALIVLRSANVYVKSFFSGVALDTAHTGTLSYDYNGLANMVMGPVAASSLRTWWAILSAAVVIVLAVSTIKAWRQEWNNVRQEHAGY